MSPLTPDRERAMSALSSSVFNDKAVEENDKAMLFKSKKRLIRKSMKQEKIEYQRAKINLLTIANE